MFDLRPVAYVCGLLVAILGLAMLIPMALDLSLGDPHWLIFAESAVITFVIGALTAISSANAVRDRLNIQQTFLLTTLVWLVLPVFGAIPFLLGATEASVTDAFFEAMSGMTTTGATVFRDLDALPAGLNIWRGLMQWFGGIGIIVVAMVFLPELRVGGMQIFRSESFDTMGKVLPRAAEIARSISWIYVVLTFACYLSYRAVGLGYFDASMHALTTMSTGGFSSTDASFAAFSGRPEYVATVFMLLASLPFVRYAQLAAGSARPLYRDTQIHAYFATVGILVVIIALYRAENTGVGWEISFREALFNITSIISGTGYASADYQLWGSAAAALFFCIGLIGGCAGSTACSVKIFRYQILFASIRAQVRKIHTPHGVFAPRFEGRPVGDDIVNSVMAFFVVFLVSLGILAILLAMTGLDFTTSVSGAASAIANIGPGLGEHIGPSGNFSTLNDPAKWLLSAGMLLGRLEVLSVLAIMTTAFWRG